MHVIDVEPGIDRAGHPFERPAPVLVDEFVPVAGYAVSTAALGEGGDEPGMPIEDRAAGIEGEDSDALHRTPPSPGARPPAPATTKFSAINLTRGSALVSSIARSA